MNEEEKAFEQALSLVEPEEPLGKLQSRLLEKTIKTLTGLNFKFKIIAPNGEVFGDLEESEETQQVKIHKRGDLVGYTRLLFNNTLPDVGVEKSIDVPRDSPYSLSDIRSSLNSWCLRECGEGSVITSINRKKNSITYLRLF